MMSLDYLTLETKPRKSVLTAEQKRQIWAEVRTMELDKRAQRKRGIHLNCSLRNTLPDMKWKDHLYHPHSWWSEMELEKRLEREEAERSRAEVEKVITAQELEEIRREEERMRVVMEGSRNDYQGCHNYMDTTDTEDERWTEFEKTFDELEAKSRKSLRGDKVRRIGKRRVRRRDRLVEKLFGEKKKKKARGPAPAAVHWESCHDWKPPKDWEPVDCNWDVDYSLEDYDEMSFSEPEPYCEPKQPTGLRYYLSCLNPLTHLRRRLVNKLMGVEEIDHELEGWRLALYNGKNRLKRFFWRNVRKPSLWICGACLFMYCAV